MFNKRAAKKMFCKTCGVPVGQETVKLSDEQIAQFDENTKQWYEGSKDQVSVNLRVLHGVDVKELSPNRFDGYNYVQPRYVEP